MASSVSADIVVIGTGAGGGTVTYALRDSGAKVLVLERGGYLPREVENWSPRSVVTHGRYRHKEPWEHNGRLFTGSNHYYVGGMTKVYGACLARLRPQDFGEYDLDEGVSPAWPIRYEDLEKFYGEAERIYGVRGRADEDPLEPPRSTGFPAPALEHERAVAELADRLRDQGLHPYTLPMGVDVGGGGRCARVRHCDGFPCPVLAKSDADMRCVRPALQSPDVSLFTHARAERLLTDRSGKRVTAVEFRAEGELTRATASKFVLCAGAANSAVLLLRSANASHPKGLANSSDQVGRNYIQHVNSALVAIDPRRHNTTVFQKTLGVNDFYLNPSGNHPRLGSLQTTGKVVGAHLKKRARWLPMSVADRLAARSIDWWLMTEDCPLPDNRVLPGPGGRIRVDWIPTSIGRHRRLVRAAARMMRRAGYPVVLWHRFGVEATAHQASTLRFGSDPSTSVLDPLCKAHDVTNLYAIDSGFLPSLGAGPGGPTLTVAAMALRVIEESDVLE